jgi:hypothetical protein
MADGPWFSELRWHSGDGRQMAIISSDHALDLQRIAGSLQLEFTSARFLRYQRDNPTLDRVGHGTIRIVNQPNEYQPGQGYRSDPAGANAFLQSVKLIAFRAQDMLMHTLYERDSELVDAEGVLRSFADSLVDLVPDLHDRALVVRARPLTNTSGIPGSKGHEQVYQYLCAALTATETRFPGTDLRLIYECICSV